MFQAVKEEERIEGPRQRPLRADDGGLWIISPSQHERVEPEGGCDQAWGFHYVEGIKTPEKKSAAFGVDVHAALETYFKASILPSVQTHVGDVALRFLKRLPLPHPSLGIEYSFVTDVAIHLTKREPIREQGKIDVYDPTRVCGFVVGEYAEINPAPKGWLAFNPLTGIPRPLIIDHKTTGSFDWLKTDAVLRGVFDPMTSACLSRPDAQPTVYGWEALENSLRYYGALPDEVHYRWNYALSVESKRQIRTVDLRMTPLEIFRNMAVLLPEAYKAIELADSTYTTFDFPKNVKACPKFGGCGYGPGTTKNPGLNICRLTSAERMRSIMSGNQPPSALAQQAASMFAGGQPANGNPFAGDQQPQANPFAQQAQQPQGNPFAGAQPQTPPASSPFGGGQQAQGNPFAAQQAPQTQQQPQANPFATQQQQPQAQQNPFAQQPQGQPMAQVMAQAGADVVNPQQNMFAGQQQQQNPFAGQQQQQPVQPTFAAPVQNVQPTFQPQVQTPAQPAVNPALKMVPQHITAQGPTVIEQYIAWCVQNKLDLASGQALPNIIPVGMIMPTGAIAVASQGGGVLFQGYNDQGQMVQGQMWENLSGEREREQPKQRRKRRTKAEIAADNAAAGRDTSSPDDDGSPQIVITEKAVKEMIAFLQSLIS